MHVTALFAYVGYYNKQCDCFCKSGKTYSTETQTFHSWKSKSSRILSDDDYDDNRKNYHPFIARLHLCNTQNEFAIKYKNVVKVNEVQL